MTDTLRIAAIQLTSGADFKENLQEVKKWVVKAADDGARVIVLPENVFLFNGKAMRDLAESDDQGVLLREVAEWARFNEVYLVVGSHPSLVNEGGELVANQRVRQSCMVFDPNGELIQRYDKIHLFDVSVDDKAGSYRESDYIEPGDLEVKMFEVDGFKVGLTICYDVRFPELFRHLSKEGAELILVPAAFTYVTGKAHWNTLLAARAIENQCFVMGVNQCGWHTQTRQTYGHSVLYSPNGEMLQQLEEEPGYFVGEIDKSSLQTCRTKMPCLEHRRFIS
ncbi:carbon-nitrogen hydrolase family protein [Marinomonas spartinae]|uniref:carbon-nitrogen hydrolase family protein n=1 Tax=Marinomonas spartinae TaxID=1792290 RepID=UPI0018F1404D|nr:carbon-nitrogen hydrolase family protein [Marinomonas spartinae]MBJ7553294.1 carbon-nitrogen hydrolase family protein [Marinomonas spartinae]